MQMEWNGIHSHWVGWKCKQEKEYLIRDLIIRFNYNTTPTLRSRFIFNFHCVSYCCWRSNCCCWTQPSCLFIYSFVTCGQQVALGALMSRNFGGMIAEEKQLRYQMFLYSASLNLLSINCNTYVQTHNYKTTHTVTTHITKPHTPHNNAHKLWTFKVIGISSFTSQSPSTSLTLVHNLLTIGHTITLYHYNMQHNIHILSTRKYCQTTWVLMLI